MKGTLANTAAILIGSLVGIVARRGISIRYQKVAMQGLGLAVLLIGLQMALKTQNILVVILSMVVGGLVGEASNIEVGLNRIGDWVAAKLGGESSTIGKGFVSASLMYCVGAMAVVGAVQEGLTGNAGTLYVKAMLDGVGSAVFASTLGPGVALASVSVLVYQGTITVLAGLFGAVLTDAAIAELTAVGGLLIMGMGITLLEIKQINIANLLPAIPVAALFAMFWPG